MVHFSIVLLSFAKVEAEMVIGSVSPPAVATETPTEITIVGTGLEEVVAVESLDEGVLVKLLPVVDSVLRCEVRIPSYVGRGFVTVALKARGQSPQEIRLPCAPSGQLVGEAEPNSSFGDAQELPVAGGPTLVIGSHQAADTQDVFTFEGGENTRLRAQLLVSDQFGELAPSLVLSDRDRLEVGGHNGGSGNQIRMSRTLPQSGEFYLAVRFAVPDGSAGAPGPAIEIPYTLEVALGDDERNPAGTSPAGPLVHVNPARIARLLPEEARPGWLAYLDRSVAQAREERRVLAEELAALGKERSDGAPSGGRPPRIPSKDNRAVWLADPGTLAVAESVLSYQTPSGGWSKSVDYSTGTRPPGTHWTSQGGDGWHYCGTLDNRATTTEILFLAEMFKTHGRDEFRRAVLRGIRWLLDAQFPNGGWPQVFPLEPGYHEHVTLNDGAMQHALEVVNGVAAGDPPFDWVEAPIRLECRDAFQAGLRCLADAQVEVGGVRTVWCAQHDPLTLAPTAARLKEPASLSGGESADMIKFLMREGTYGETVRDMILAAVEWLTAHRITGLRQAVTGEGKTTYKPDPHSEEVYWARFYHPVTFEPMFTGSDDGVVYDSFIEMARFNKVAYSYLTTRPGPVLSEKELARWKKRIAGTDAEF